MVKCIANNLEWNHGFDLLPAPHYGLGTATKASFINLLITAAPISATVPKSPLTS